MENKGATFLNRRTYQLDDGRVLQILMTMKRYGVILTAKDGRQFTWEDFEDTRPHQPTSTELVSNARRAVRKPGSTATQFRKTKETVQNPNAGQTGNQETEKTETRETVDWGSVL